MLVTIYALFGKADNCWVWLHDPGLNASPYAAAGAEPMCDQ